MAAVGSPFQATSDEDFIGLESSLEVEILVTNLPLYNRFDGEKKKSCHFGIYFSFKVANFCNVIH